MDVFENKVNPDKFRYTNKIWNDLELNKPWSLGMLSRLINLRRFNSKEEWKEFYFFSGQKRLELIKKKDIFVKSILTQRIQPKASLDNQYISTNYNYGRTEEELKYKGFILYEEILKKGNPLKITLQECIYMVLFRTIGETWNGIVQRERNTIKILEKEFKEFNGVRFVKTNGSKDTLYEVDYDVYFKGKIIAGLQIKPKSYLSLEDAELKALNMAKNGEYKNLYGADVIYIYSDFNGTIGNLESIKNLREIIKECI
ncbi:hypothetical protein [Clostridium perfringens]|uniref:hypothetical protein n=1 Tax=Clostridium perfringens TaxID=1502 RepID=UPI0039E768FA